MSELPPGWVEKMSKSKGIKYYFNEGTGETTWDKPTKSSADDKPEWEEAMTPEGKIYYKVCNTGRRAFSHIYV
jgi:hypothetical protein